MKKMIEVSNMTMEFNLANDRILSLKEFVVAIITKRLKYDKFVALNKIDLCVNQGEVIGIVGKNGSGKSTLLKLLSGILKPTDGTIVRNAKIVPMLELGSGFDFELTGRENIFLNGSILGYTEEFLKSKYDDIVSFSELGKFIEVPIRNYSSGMMMRLAFSIATVVNPEILIVDEILAVGDADFQEKSKRRMLELMGDGTTVLFVSHSLEQIRELCTRVIWLEKGVIKAQGNTQEICDLYMNS